MELITKLLAFPVTHVKKGCREAYEGITWGQAAASASILVASA